MYIHNLNPVLFDCGIIEIRWYSLAYIFGILSGWWLGKKIFKYRINIKKKHIHNGLKEISVRKNIICFPDIDESEKPFLDSIEIIKQMDLVITADTSTAHLSATLGKKTWIILPFLSDWRWFLKKSESNWYKNVKLFRSEEIDNLDTAFKSVEKDF